MGHFNKSIRKDENTSSFFCDAGTMCKGVFCGVSPEEQRQTKLLLTTLNAVLLRAGRKRRVSVYMHGVGRTSSGYLSSQPCIWPSLGNAFEALQATLLRSTMWRTAARRGGEKLLFTTVWQVRNNIELLLSNLWCPARAGRVQLWRARLKTFQGSQDGGTSRNEKWVIFHFMTGTWQWQKHFSLQSPKILF